MSNKDIKYCEDCGFYDNYQCRRKKRLLVRRDEEKDDTTWGWSCQALRVNDNLCGIDAKWFEAAQAKETAPEDDDLEKSLEEKYEEKLNKIREWVEERVTTIEEAYKDAANSTLKFGEAATASARKDGIL